MLAVLLLLLALKWRPRPVVSPLGEGRDRCSTNVVVVVVVVQLLLMAPVMEPPCWLGIGQVGRAAIAGQSDRRWWGAVHAVVVTTHVGVRRL
jgi:hypothetical protein